MQYNKLLNIALLLSVITIGYNIIEGLISVYFGFSDETLSLFGFGVDSFIEVMSGIGILHMIIRIRKNDNRNTDSFERTALKITGLSFLILAAGLIITIGINIYTRHEPVTTFWGIVISCVSILTMMFLFLAKKHTGLRLLSDAIIADANCTKTCIYLSVILLLSSLIYQVFGTGIVDFLGALGIAYYAFREGKESFEKVKGKSCCD